jgi:hypothetical protein
MVDANLCTAQTAKIFLSVIGASTIKAVSFLMVDPLHFETLVQAKAELKRADITYEELAKRLKKHGLPNESADSIKAKLKRATFAATFFLACLAAMELEGAQYSRLARYSRGGQMPPSGAAI